MTKQDTYYVSIYLLEHIFCGYVCIRVCVYVYLYIYVCIYGYMYICIYTRAHTHTHIHISVTLEKACVNVIDARRHIHVCMHSCVQGQQATHIIQYKSTINITKQDCIPNDTSTSYVCIRVCVYVYLYIYVCIYVRLYS